MRAAILPRVEPALRASDADRERVVRALGSHLAAGRLSVDEFGERVDRAYAALTVGDLRGLVADLPAAAKAPVRGARRSRFPGNSPFVVRFQSDKPPAEVIDDAVVTAGHALAGAGYQLQSRGRDQLVFVAERRPLWTFVVAVFVPFFGLLALTHKSRSHVIVSAQPDARGRTTVELYGVAPLRVRRAIDELSQ